MSHPLWKKEPPPSQQKGIRARVIFLKTASNLRLRPTVFCLEQKTHLIHVEEQPRISGWGWNPLLFLGEASCLSYGQPLAHRVLSVHALMQPASISVAGVESAAPVLLLPQPPSKQTSFTSRIRSSMSPHNHRTEPCRGGRQLIVAIFVPVEGLFPALLRTDAGACPALREEGDPACSMRMAFPRPIAPH